MKWDSVSKIDQSLRLLCGLRYQGKPIRQSLCNQLPAKAELTALCMMKYNYFSHSYHSFKSAASGWVDTVEHFGSKSLSLQEILEPAIQLAEQGFPVGPVCAYAWARSENLLKNSSPSGSEMLLDGVAPKEGQIMRMPALAQTFRDLAQFGKKGFYEGRIAKAIVDIVKQLGGILTEQDLKSHYNTMVCTMYSTLTCIWSLCKYISNTALSPSAPKISYFPKP